jgi:hypothetical protein
MRWRCLLVKIATIVEVAAYMLSCPERAAVRAQTIASFRQTDWGVDAEVEVDRTTFESRAARNEHTALRLLTRAVEDGHEVILFLEDDLVFNAHLRHNLEHWPPLAHAAAEQSHFLGSLYNPDVAWFYRDERRAVLLADAASTYGAQAIVLTRPTAAYAVDHWWEEPGMADMKLSRLAARLCSIAYHVPSLVEHMAVPSVWGGPQHRALDFDPQWRTPAAISGG